MDPELTANAAAPSEAATQPAPTQQAAASSTAPADGSISLTPAEYKLLLAKIGERDKLAAAAASAQKTSDEAKLKALAEKGQFEDALRLQREQAEQELHRAKAARDEAHRRYLDRERSLAVNDATAGTAFISEFAARQARQFLESRFDVIPDESGAAQVVDKASRRPAADVAKEWLASPEAAHFLAPKGKGGSPTQQGSTQTDAGNPEPEGQLTYEQAVMKAFKEAQARRAETGWQTGVVQQARHRAAVRN